jgi:serine/threonine-protein kinase
MDGARWDLIQGLFHQAAELPRPAWRSFLQSACGDEALVNDVLAMLEEDARGASLLDRGVVEAAQRMMGGAAAPAPPDDFGPYRITGVLGEGGMGVVYRAERTDVGSVVAIKVLRDAWLSPARRDRFVRERRMLAQLDHPSIARLHDAGALADGTPWFVMEYVRGVPITEHCRAQGSSIEDRLRFFRQVCQAVQHAHQHLVIHRDLKPSNILVTSEGTVKLLDFGISKQIDGPHRGGDETRTGLRLMTPAYAAPEQIRGEPAGVDSDVYSLGVVLYELLIGRPPFDLSELTPSEAEVVIVAREAERPSVAAARALRSSSAERAGGSGVGGVEVPTASRAAWADLDVLSLTAMHKERGRRYQTAAGLIRDVDHFLAGEPLEARPDDVRYRAGKFVARNWRPLAGAAAAFAVIVGLVVFYTVRVTTARNVALAEAARTQRIQRFMLSLFEGGDKEAGPTEGLRAVTLVDRGVKEAQSLVGEPAVQAELYEALGSIYQKLGDLPQADSLLRRALEQRRAMYGPEHADVGKSMVGLGLLRNDQAQFEEAERLIRQGLATARRKLPPNHPDVTRAMTALGTVLEARGQYAQAIPVLDEAVRVQTASGRDTPDLAASVTELANCHFYAGHYDVCRSLNQRALALDRKLHGERHPLVSSDLFNLGAIEFELGRYPEAERFYRQGLDITEAWYGPDHRQTAADATMLARVFIKEDRRADAAALLRRALAINERVYGPVHPSVASVLNELGLIAAAAGDQDQAETYFRRMLEIYRQVYGGKKHYLIAVASANLGSVYLTRGDLDCAEPLFRQALAIDTELLSPDHPNTAIARIKLGRTLLRRQRYVEAESQTRAGYEALKKQAKPTINWLKNAREDLIEEYQALRQPERAQSLRAELASIH